MFVLLCLMNLCLRSVLAPLLGMVRPPAPVKRAQAAMKLVAFVETPPLVPIHAPTLRRLV